MGTDFTGSESQVRVDQIWDGEFLTSTPDINGDYTVDVGRIFSSHYVQNSVTWWVESWVATDWGQYPQTPNLKMSYLSPSTDADAFIYGLQQVANQGPPLIIYRMDTLSTYQTFDVSTPPVSTLPHVTPGDLTKKTYAVFNEINGIKTKQGMLYRESKMIIPPTGPEEQLRIDHWVYYSTYQMPQDATVSTIVEEDTDPAHQFTNPYDFAMAVANVIAPADGGTPQWFVRTTALFRQV